MKAPSKEFTVSLSALLAVSATLIALKPVYAVANAAETNAINISVLKGKQEQDHDVLVRMANDIDYIKQYIREQRERTTRP